RHPVRCFRQNRPYPMRRQQDSALMASNTAQKASPSYRLALEDRDFLLRDEMRAVRFAMEYGKAELALRDWGVRSTVVVFGSARIPPPEQAEALVAAAPPERRARAEALARLSP